MREPFEVFAVFHFNPLKLPDAVASVFFRPTEGHERTQRRAKCSQML